MGIYTCYSSLCQREKRSKRLFFKYISVPITPSGYHEPLVKETLQSYEIIPGKENINTRKATFSISLPNMLHSFTCVIFIEIQRLGVPVLGREMNVDRGDELSPKDVWSYRNKTYYLTTTRRIILLRQDV